MPWLGIISAWSFILANTLLAQASKRKSTDIKVLKFSAPVAPADK
jgi:hypothetical protein